MSEDTAVADDVASLEQKIAQAIGTTGVIKEFDPKRVRPLPRQPRTRFKGIKDLAVSIAKVGQTQAGIVTELVGDPNYDAQLIDGERRLRACLSIDRPFRAEIQLSTSDGDSFVKSFAANFGKQDHDCIEIMQGLVRLRDECNKTREEMAAISGHSIGWVGQYLSLAKLHPEIHAMMVSDDEDEDVRPQLTFMLGQLLTGVEDQAEQLRMAKHIIKAKLTVDTARNYIYAERAKTEGNKVYLGDSRNRSLLSLAGLCQTGINKLGSYSLMPPEVLTTLVADSTRHSQNKVTEALQQMADECLGLKEQIEKAQKAGIRNVSRGALAKQ